MKRVSRIPFVFQTVWEVFRLIGGGWNQRKTAGYYLTEEGANAAASGMQNAEVSRRKCLILPDGIHLFSSMKPVQAEGAPVSIPLTEEQVSCMCSLQSQLLTLEEQRALATSWFLQHEREKELKELLKIALVELQKPTRYRGTSLIKRIEEAVQNTESDILREEPSCKQKSLDQR